jgi:NosR/NirI family nitrous oxide reductase transcriptional regulator
MVKPQTQPRQEPPSAGGEKLSVGAWLWIEAKDHLLPWGPGFLAQRTAVQAAGIGLAVVVTVAWLLAATGRISSVAVIAWWCGWSAYEVVCRRRCKPWVKEGPWWQRNLRPAGTVDIIFYVATKNLLIGVVLFLLLNFLGQLPP